MRTFVIFDSHGQYSLVKGLLKEVGIYQEKKAAKILGRESTQFKVIHIGDLANCVADSVEGDLKSLSLVEKGYIDTLLVGNHEHPYFGGPKFSGFRDFPEVKDPLRRLYFEGRLVAGYADQGILFTHAGLNTSWSFDSAEQASDHLNDIWQRNPTYPIFSDIGLERGGDCPEGGGILWADWKEEKCSDFDQVVGHTPQRVIPPVEITHPNGRRVVCGDWGGKWGDHLAGCWVLPEGELDWVLYERKNGG